MATTPEKPSGKSAKPSNVKTSPAKAASKKPVKKTTASNPRPTLASLNSQLNVVEARLKKAQSQTQRRVKALSDDFTSLASAQDTTTERQARALDAQMSALSKRLTDDMAQVQSTVTRGLSAAMNNPTFDNLQNAISESHRHLAEAERKQAHALATINRSLADLAVAVDARLSEEAKLRRDAMAEMKRTQDQTLRNQNETLRKFDLKLSQNAERIESKVTLRLSELEAEHANALRGMGDKVVALAEDLNSRAEDGEALIKERVNEIAVNTQAELEQFKLAISRRLDRVEDNLRGTDSHLDRSVASLTARVEGLEYGLTSTPVSPAAQSSYGTAPQMSATIIAEQDNLASEHKPAVQLTAQSSVVETFMQNELAAGSIAAGADNAGDRVREVPSVGHGAPPPYNRDDAFSPDAPLAVPVAMARPPVQTVQAPEPAPAAPKGAVPYDPSAYAAPVVQPHSHLSPQQNNAQYDTNPYAAPPQTAGRAAPYVPHSAAVLPTEDMPLPYADPAYAEGQNPYAFTGQTAGQADDTMEAARPGVFKSKTSKTAKKSKKPKAAKADGGRSILTPRNMRVGAMVAGLSALAIVASQTVLRPALSAPDSPFGAPLQIADMDQNEPSGMDPVGTVLPGVVVNTEAPIGNYADNQAAPIQSPEASTALERAAASGDAVAQLQLGLSKLETGATAEGVALIRLAANQDQPAALYRLAKLYETGEGVTADLSLAFTLTERAAKGGNRIAMHDLGNFYANDVGVVDVDMDQATKWFQEAAQRGVVDSQFNMGVLFDAEGLNPNPELSLYWYGVAASQGDRMAEARMNALRAELPEDVLSKTDARIASFRPQKIDPLANGIFDTGKSTAQVNSAPPKNMPNSAVMKTQSLLAGLGYEVGSPDGAMGPRTRSAIISFERSNGLPETGRVNAALIERLELASGA